MRYLLPQAVYQSADKYPDREAIRFTDQSLSYQELELRSNSLARTLIDRGLERGNRVGIYMNKSLESAIAIYGIMKAGGVYVPIDPFAPVSRISFVIQDCGIKHLVTNNSKLEILRQLSIDERCPEILIGVTQDLDLSANCISWEEVNQAPGNTLHLNLTEQDLAYILYTSGSTGTPKGIMHTHRSGLSFAEWAAHTYKLTFEDRLSNHAPLHFDLSTFDYFAGAIAGASIIVIPEVLTKFPANLSKLIEEEQITVWYSVPFALIQLMQRGGIESRDLSSLRWILFAGEIFPTKHLRTLVNMFPKVGFSNLYGPTETNVCTYYHVTVLPEGDETIPIGISCANIEDLVVDSDDQPVLPGEVGELLIRGGVVMKGYWGQPEKTAACFYRRPAFNQFEDLFYRTGDLVKLDSEGNYLYLGRKDRQIKTRGYRVELDEVETVLLSYSSIEEAAAYPVPDGQGSNLIHANITLRQGHSILESDLITHLHNLLPHYAVPAKIEILNEFPRTSTGKIDRRALRDKAISKSPI